MIPVPHELEDIVQAVWRNLQPIAVYSPGGLCPLPVDRRQVVAHAGDRPAVEVDAEVVERDADRLEIAGPDVGQDVAIDFEHVGRVGALEEGIQIPAVLAALPTFCCSDILGAVAGRLDGVEVEHDPGHGVFDVRADDRHGGAMREEGVMSCGQGAARAELEAGRVLAQRVAAPGEDPGLVERRPVPDAIAKRARDHVRRSARNRRRCCGAASRLHPQALAADPNDRA